MKSYIIRVTHHVLITIVFLTFGMAETFDTLSLVDIGSEIQALERQFRNLPQSFNENILSDLESKLDLRVGILSNNPDLRRAIENPGYHWCLAKIYQLSGSKSLAKRHYLIYLDLTQESKNLPAIFKQPILGVSLAQEDDETDIPPDPLETDTEPIEESSQNDTVETVNIPIVDVDRTLTLSADDLAQLPIQSVFEALEYISGFYLKNRGSLDARTSLTAMGGSSDQVILLVNGLRSYNFHAMFNDFNLPFDLENVERITIDFEPSSMKYGFGATGAVVNIDLKTIEKFNTVLNWQGGDYSHNRSHVHVNVPMGKSYHTLSYTANENDGYVYNSDAEFTKLLYRYSLSDGNSAADLSFGIHNDTLGVLGDVNQFGNYARETSKAKFFDSRLSWKFGSLMLDSYTHWYENQYNYSENRDRDIWSLLKITDLGYDFNGSNQYDNGSSSFGFSAGRESVLGLTEDDVQRDRMSFYLGYRRVNGNLLFDMGVNGSYFDVEDIEWNYSPGYSLTYSLTEKVNLYHLYDKGFRIPSVFELYADTEEFTGNSTLSMEEVGTFSYGLDVNDEDLSVDVTFFKKTTDNAMDWLYSETSKTWNSTNVTQMVTNGHRLYADIDVSQVPLIGFLSSVSLGYTYLDVQMSDANSYRFSTNYLKHQMVMSFNHNLFLGITQSWAVRYEEPSLSETRWITDTQVRIPLWKFDAVYSIKNLMDIDYEDESGLDLAGRWMKFSVQYQY